MKSLALTSIYTALFTVVTTPTQADFINESQLDIKLRNVSFDVNTKDRNGDWREWSQAAALNLGSSGITVGKFSRF